MGKKKIRDKNSTVLAKANEKQGSKNLSPSNTNFRNYYFALFIIAFALYGNTVLNKYAFDDSVVITDNKFTKQGFAGIPKLITKDLFAGIHGQSLDLTGGRYRPLSLVTHAIEYQFFGANPGISHFINVLLFAFCGLILFKTLLRIFPQFTLFSFVATLIFIVHPIHTEVVANIKSRDEILCFLFLSLTLLYLFKFISSQNRKDFLWSCCFYFLSLLSKENGVTFLAIIPLILICFTTTNFKKAITLTLPYLLLALVFLGIRSGLLDTGKIKDSADLMENPFYGLSFIEKIPGVILIVGKYLLLLFFPHPLSSDYSYNQIPNLGWGNIMVLSTLAAMIALIVFAINGILKSKNEQTVSSKKLICFGILFFFISISIVSNLFFNIGAPLGERFLFLPSLGFCIAFSALLFYILKLDLTNPLKLQTKLLIPLGFILVLCSFKTITRNKDWYDNMTLFEKDINASPQSAKIHYYYGNTLLLSVLKDLEAKNRKETLLKAKGEFHKSIAIYPTFIHSLYNLGLIYNDFGNADSAIIVLNKVLEIQPTHIHTQGLLGEVYGKLKKDYPKSISYLKTAIKYNPNDIPALENLGIAYASSGNFSEAIKILEQIISINPDKAVTYKNLGSLYGNMGDTMKSKQYFEKAKQLGGQ